MTRTDMYLFILGCVLLSLYLYDHFSPEFPKKTLSVKMGTEAYYQLKINEIVQGEIEYKLSDGTRVDILTDDYAIEVDFARKFYEAMGQAAHYAIRTNRKPAIWLIATKKSDEKYIDRAMKNANDTKVTVGKDEFNIGVFVYRTYK
jgi:hypothetical protein